MWKCALPCVTISQCTDKASVHLYLSQTPLLLLASTPSLWPALSLKYATVCRHTACLAGGGASPGQTEGAGGGAHGGEAEPAEIRAAESPLPPDPGIAEVCPSSQRTGEL